MWGKGEGERTLQWRKESLSPGPSATYSPLITCTTYSISCLNGKVFVCRGGGGGGDKGLQLYIQQTVKKESNTVAGLGFLKGGFYSS